MTMPPESSAPTLSPMDNEMPVRWLHRLRLVPPNELGTVRRAVFLALLAWLPIVIWTVTSRRLGNIDPSESLLQHYGVHVRCLLAIPLLILAEGPVQTMLQKIVQQFHFSGIAPSGPGSAFNSLIAEVRRARDGTMPWIVVLGAAFTWAVTNHPSNHDDAMNWAVAADGDLGFGGWWFSYVARPIFIALVLGWVWRVLLVTWCFWRISRLDLSLVPAHPDRTGGMGFLAKLPRAFALVTFVLSATISSHWAHEIVIHGAKLDSFKMPALLFVVLWTVYLLLPLLVFAPTLFAARSHAVAAYAALVGRQGRLLHRRWILGETVEDETILEAPGIGVVADAASMYEAVSKMRLVPIGGKTLLYIAVPMALPFIVVASLQIPFLELLMKLAKAL
ncbi:hypothetical protein WKW80_22030 [Variovorax humicola]|uniref:Uncharacterized protein n=1 Tax=Variovorax humicola TaxID=1769758 RepID=A0ABU8W450_9BURK